MNITIQNLSEKLKDWKIRQITEYGNEEWYVHLQKSFDNTTEYKLWTDKFRDSVTIIDTTFELAFSKAVEKVQQWEKDFLS